ncbi:MAG TPA: CoB--CoM heterodisulfide reductase iron-sulfur subunit A family protein [Euryarchaeota archaeon]|nr:CoB--CoM heterodisulfide reductase iron-sulfur subunit A family protein [Euryarchaeota archaeon]
MENDKSNEELRVGVFVCHCGTNIGGFVDVPSVAEYAKTLPGVVFAMDNLYTCAEDGLAAIKNAIKEHKLNRVVVASCTPRTHAPLFQATVEEAGLNKYLFTFVNIREHCSWVHMKEKEKATEKARDLVRMGVARVKLLSPQEEPRIPVEKSALVIGGGVAGMTAAHSLAKMGFPVHLVEKEKELGGFVRNLNNLYVTTKDATETIMPLIEKVKSHPNIKVYLNSKVSNVHGFIGNFDVKIKPNDKDEEVEHKVGSIIVATGAIEYTKEALYGYNVYKNVVTLTEFEIMCKNKTLPKVKNVAFIQCAGSRGQDVSYCSRICCNVAIKNAINIVDNYDNLLGIAEQTGKAVEEVPVEPKAPTEVLERRRRRSSRGRGREDEEVAEEVKRGPGERIEVTIFNRDIMSYGIAHELYFNKAREKRVRFVRYKPDRRPEVIMDGDKLMIKYFHETLAVEREMPVDLVILSTPLIAQPDAEDISRLLKVPCGQDGFFLEAHVKLRPVDFATDGVFVCGTARGPADITESIEQAEAAASRAATPLAAGYVQAEAIMAHVDQEICSGCGTCIDVCPYGAITKNEEGLAEVVAAACKGCGCCGASCPENAISMTNYTDEQLMAEALAALKEAI